MQSTLIEIDNSTRNFRFACSIPMTFNCAETFSIIDYNAHMHSALSSCLTLIILVLRSMYSSKTGSWKFLIFTYRIFLRKTRIIHQSVCSDFDFCADCHKNHEHDEYYLHMIRAASSMSTRLFADLSLLEVLIEILRIDNAQMMISNLHSGVFEFPC